MGALLYRMRYSPPMPPSRLVAKTGLFLAATLFSLALSELLVRIVRDPRPMELQEQRRVFPTYYPLAEGGLFTRDRDSRLRYRLTPGFEMELRDSLYRINSLGFRGREQTFWGHPETRRVVLLGDSYAFGLGVDQSQTLAAQLESRLQASCRSVAVLNLGVPGYHTGQELALAERVGFDLDPDLMVLLFYANDETTEAFQYDPATRVLYGDALPVPYWLKGPLARSAAYRWLARAKVGRMRTRGDLTAMGDRHWPVTRSRLESLFQACANRGVPVVLANVPMLLSSETLQRPDWTGHQNCDLGRSTAGPPPQLHRILPRRGCDRRDADLRKPAIGPSGSLMADRRPSYFFGFHHGSSRLQRIFQAASVSAMASPPSLTSISSARTRASMDSTMTGAAPMAVTSERSHTVAPASPVFRSTDGQPMRSVDMGLK